MPLRKTINRTQNGESNEKIAGWHKSQKRKATGPGPLRRKSHHTNTHLVADLVGVTLTDRLGGEKEVVGSHC